MPSGETARGVFLQAATYHDDPSFTPVIARGWAVGEQRRPAPQAASPTLSGWDHIRPYELGHFVGLSNTVASLNLVLGAFHSEEQRERLFDKMTLAVLYSNSADQTSPVITTTAGYMTAAGILLQVIAGDNEQVAQVQGVCDNGTGQWTVVPLAKTGAGWSGYCPADAIRFYSEVADKAGNTVADEWTTPSTEPLVVEVLYLPLIRR